MTSQREADRLLTWYDTHARTLPWRVGPAARAAGERADPYRVWLSEIMLQQTTVAAVQAYFQRFTTLWPTVHDLAAAEDADVMSEWAGLGYYARARNLLKCAREVSAAGGVFPERAEALQKLPGIGPYTAAAIAAIAFDHAETVVDGNVERVMARYFAVETPLPDAKPALREAAARLTPVERPGDYAQAVMDLGATVCRPRTPDCLLCPISDGCAGRMTGIAPDLPAKRAKAPKPTRFGHAYVAIREDGAVLLEDRPEKGLLGGTRGFPGSEWREDNASPKPPVSADWVESAEPVKHTFTHFHLLLTVHRAAVPETAKPAVGRFHPQNSFTDRALPTVMRKVYARAMKDAHG